MNVRLSLFFWIYKRSLGKNNSLGRKWKAHQREDQALFGIIQGGMYRELREQVPEKLFLWTSRIWYWGLSVGEPKELMYEMLDYRYLWYLRISQISYGVGALIMWQKELCRGRYVWLCLTYTNCQKWYIMSKGVKL